MMRRRRLLHLGIGCLIVLGLTGCVLFNHPPTADFSATPVTGPAPLTVYFDASTSSDPDGDALTYSWDFDDGGTATFSSGFHTFAAAGTYDVTLTVHDPSQHPSQLVRSILVTEPDNESPEAAFLATPTSGNAPLTVVFNASSSSDPDGTIVSYDWDFGDAATGSGLSATHLYPSQGAYIVTLVVEDDGGATDAAHVAVLVNEPGNQVPVADFTASTTVGFPPFDVDFDATASYDPDGTVAAYLWDFGDGDTGSGATITHTFDTTGTFTVVLTVIDNDGAPASDVIEIRSLYFIGPIIIPPLLPTI